MPGPLPSMQERAAARGHAPSGTNFARLTVGVTAPAAALHTAATDVTSVTLRTAAAVRSCAALKSSPETSRAPDPADPGGDPDPGRDAAPRPTTRRGGGGLRWWQGTGTLLSQKRDQRCQRTTPDGGPTLTTCHAVHAHSTAPSPRPPSPPPSSHPDPLAFLLLTACKCALRD